MTLSRKPRPLPRLKIVGSWRLASNSPALCLLLVQDGLLPSDGSAKAAPSRRTCLAFRRQRAGTSPREYPSSAKEHLLSHIEMSKPQTSSLRPELDISSPIATGQLLLQRNHIMIPIDGIHSSIPHSGFRDRCLIPRTCKVRRLRGKPPKPGT